MSLLRRGLGSATAKLKRPRFKEPVSEKFHREKKKKNPKLRAQ